ncbi:hypothetical protein Bca52824_005212 [Brassica carinata]|uniref:Uncharacterized protein n=1 Tax=Brassica carinata TaxID=52824 RepID=A0A8X8BHC5_BRACI|nr:hypothetical protein Bca52824_005212 [Brassica carinata]
MKESRGHAIAVVSLLLKPRTLVKIRKEVLLRNNVDDGDSHIRNGEMWRFKKSFVKRRHNLGWSRIKSLRVTRRWLSLTRSWVC